MILEKIKAKFSKSPNTHLKDFIKEIGLSDRSYHCLRRAGIVVVGDLTQLSWNDIAKMRGVVRKTVEEVEGVLKGLGLKLKEDEK